MDYEVLRQTLVKHIHEHEERIAELEAENQALRAFVEVYDDKCTRTPLDDARAALTQYGLPLPGAAAEGDEG